MTKKNRILVTGGNGLVGNGIRLALETRPRLQRDDEEWFYVSSREADLRVKSETEALFDKYEPTHVVNLAAMVGGLFHHQRHNCEFLRNNLLINDSVTRTCYERKVKKLITCLSTCIFPDKTTYPLDEDMILLGPPHDSNFGYSYAKRMVLVQNRAYHNDYGCNFTSVIPTNVYGPFDNFNIEVGHVMPGLVHKAVVAAQNGSKMTVFGTGKPLRQFIYSLDLGELIIRVLREYDQIDPIMLSVGPEDEVTVKDAALTVAKAAGLDPEKDVVFDTTRADGQFMKTAGIKKLRAYFPDFKFTPLEVGIKETVEWFRENQATARK